MNKKVLSPAVTIEQHQCVGAFCIANIHDMTQEDVRFSFNLGYLFNYVDDEHKEWFLQEVFTKKLFIQWNLAFDASITWNKVDFKKILEQMRTLYLT